MMPFPSIDGLLIFLILFLFTYVFLPGTILTTFFMCFFKKSFIWNWCFAIFGVSIILWGFFDSFLFQDLSYLRKITGLETEYSQLEKMKPKGYFRKIRINPNNLIVQFDQPILIQSNELPQGEYYSPFTGHGLVCAPSSGTLSL